MNGKRLLLISLSTVILSLLSFTDLFSEGGIDWINGKIIASGTNTMNIDDNGIPFDEENGVKISMAESRSRSYEISKEKAISEAAILINSIKVEPGITIKDLIEKDPIVRQNIVKVIHEYSKFRDNPQGYINTKSDIEIHLGYLLTALNLDFPEEPFPVRLDTEITT